MAQSQRPGKEEVDRTRTIEKPAKHHWLAPPGVSFRFLKRIIQCPKIRKSQSKGISLVRVVDGAVDSLVLLNKPNIIINMNLSIVSNPQPYRVCFLPDGEGASASPRGSRQSWDCFLHSWHRQSIPMFITAQLSGAHEESFWAIKAFGI